MSKLRIGFAILSARVVSRGLRLCRRGATTLPGRVAIRICPQIISVLSQGKCILAITGTNGKTTTTHMITAILRARGYAVITNVSGANLATGIASTLVAGIHKEKKAIKANQKVVYVLETDEAAFAKVCGALRPKVCVVTNLFRDQLDRYGELVHTQNFLAKGLDSCDAKILLNADDSLVASLSNQREKRSVFFGMQTGSMYGNSVTNADISGVGETTTDASYCSFCQTKYEYHAKVFGHLGDFFCPKCGYKRPALDFSVYYNLPDSPGEKGISDEGFPITLMHGDRAATVELPIPGLHNFYNTMAAVAACTVFGEQMQEEALDFADCAKAVCEVKPAFGRMEKIKVGNKYICLLLVKNPVGLERALSFVSSASDTGAMFLLLNSNDADGKDVSWIWDVDFETKTYPREIFVSGERYGDMFLRLIYADIDKERLHPKPMCDCAMQIDEALAVCAEGKCLYILPNYTAMLALREILVKRYKLKDFWK